VFLKKQNGRNGNGTTKGAQKCRTPGCTCTANETGYCFACELAWKQFGEEVSGWYALKDAAERANGARR